MYIKTCSDVLKYHEYAMLYMWSFLYKGATIWFWSGGGGAGKFCRDRIFFSAWGRPENLFSGILRPEYLFSPATKFWKSTPPQKKKNTTTTRGVGGRNVALFRLEGWKERIFYMIFISPAWKVPRGHHVIGLSVRPSVHHFFPLSKSNI